MIALLVSDMLKGGRITLSRIPELGDARKGDKESKGKKEKGKKKGVCVSVKQQTGVIIRQDRGVRTEACQILHRCTAWPVPMIQGKGTRENKSPI